MEWNGRYYVEGLSFPEPEPVVPYVEPEYAPERDEWAEDWDWWIEDDDDDLEAEVPTHRRPE